MPLWDITRDLTESTPVYPGDRPVRLRLDAALAEAGADVRSIELSLHAGTHLDAPSHLGLEGTVADLEPERLMGDCAVLDLTGAAALDVKLVRAAWERLRLDEEPPSRILLRTDRGLRDVWTSDYPVPSPEACTWLLSRGVALLGVDTPSVDPAQGLLDAHRTLLSGGALILENLDLRDVPEGRYRLTALPLKLSAEAAPVRALLEGPY